jgi:hypothetical protein
MEILLFALFMLFSIGSSLLERRKRRKQLEEAREAERGQGTGTKEAEKEEIEEAQTLGWPFGGGSDPFEEEVVRRRIEEVMPQEPARPAPRSVAEQHQLEADLEAVEAEKKALEEERYALAAERLGRERVVPRQRVDDLVHEKMRREKAPAKPRSTRRGKYWRLDRKTARAAIVYAEILGPPKADRNEVR